MRALGLVLVQLRYEQRVFWRNIGAASFAYAAYAPTPGATFSWWHVAVVAVWGAAAFLFALRYFRWSDK